MGPPSTGSWSRRSWPAGRNTASASCTSRLIESRSSSARGDATIDEWKELRSEAASGRNGRTASYLLGEPMLGDLLADGLDEFGIPWGDERTTPVQ